MALVKPTINDISAFDAKSAYTVTFTASGGDQVVKNEIYITLNGDVNESSVYNNTVTTYDLSHIIPANTLMNGRYYKVKIRTYDRLNNASAWSDYYPFYCYTTPSLYFTNNVPSTITTSSYNFSLTYAQIEGEKLDYAIIRLYNNNNVEIKNSGNLYSTSSPPIVFNYIVNNLENYKQYKIRATAMTVNGTMVDTGLISFIVNYNTIPIINELTATLDNCNNYINVKSDVVMRMGAESNPTTLTYLYNNTEVDLISTTATLNDTTSHPQPLSYTSWVKWSNFDIPNNFILRLWVRPARHSFKILSMRQSTNNYLNLSIYYYKGNTTDYINVTFRDGNGVIVLNKDLSLDSIHCNGNTKIFIYLKFNGTSSTLQGEVIENPSTILKWNNTNGNNIKYNTTSNIRYKNENYGTYSPSTATTSTNSYHFDTVLIANGIFDHLNISKNLTLPYSIDIPTRTTIDDVLNIDFNGRIGDDNNYTRLLLKRKDETMNEWLNVCEINDIPFATPTQIDFNDSFVPSNIEQTYAFVTYINNIPSDYYTVKVTPKWAKYCISDSTNKFTLNYAVIYSNHTQNIQNGVFLPIGAKYPIVIQNGEGNYKSGSLQFKILGYQFEENRVLDRFSMTKQLDDILIFLTNGKPKCLTDFNGNIYIFKIINSPQISYDANWGNSIPTISCDWVEQGKYNNVSDMSSLGFFSVATE